MVGNFRTAYLGPHITVHNNTFYKKIYDKRFDSKLSTFRWKRTQYNILRVYVSQLIRFSTVCSHVNN
jgi:hypothetical protein